MISIQALSHSYGDKAVLEDISLEVQPGEIVAIMGSSGGGKTTLLRCVSGLVTPTSGTVIVDGIDVRQDPDEARRRMGMVFQSSALFDSLTVLENVEFGLKRRTKLKPREISEQVSEILKIVGLEGTEHLMPAELSGGMRKRVGIARALVLRPCVMLYDEPTTGLDPITTYTIDHLIVDVRRQNAATTLLVSHDVSSVFRTADRIAFLESGRLTFVGTAEEFQQSRREAIMELVHKAQAQILAGPY